MASIWYLLVIHLAKFDSIVINNEVIAIRTLVEPKALCAYHMFQSTVEFVLLLRKGRGIL